MKRIYSITTLLFCTLFAVQSAAQIQLPRRGQSQSTTPTAPRNNTPAPRTTTPPPVKTNTPAQQPQGQTAAPRTTTTQAPQVQPKARQAQAAAKDESATSGVSIRAQSQYNAQREVPSDLVWKREIYRILDLEKEENAGLLDPAVPTGNRMNMFTMIFKLLADRKLQAYEYTLDGIEQFDNGHKADFKEILDRFHILYRRKRIAATNDTVFVVENSDIPSNEVLSYYIKEVWYYDQNNSSFHTNVTALCPVLHRSGDFDLNTVKYPLFWIKVSDLAPYMNQISIPTSAYNNAANVDLDDFFAMRMYDGEIYKTNNPSGKTLAQMVPADSSIVKEQKLIESQLEGVESHLWSSQILASDTTLTKETDTKGKKASSTTEEAAEDKPNTRRKTSDESKSVKSSSSSGGGGSAPKATVRRQRR